MSSQFPLGCTDIHSHLLPGLDDGPHEFAQTLVAAERYHAIGVESVIATPHWIQSTAWAPTPGLVRERAVETEKNIRAAGVPLHVLPGMEIALTDFLCGSFSPSEFVSLGESGLFLIEFPLNSAVHAPTREAVRTLLARRKKNQFIVAHPERCAMFQHNTGLVRELVDQGMLIQINISSVLGYGGRCSQQSALTLLNDRLVHFLGTDSHARPGRMPPSPPEMNELVSRIGIEAVTSGFRDNPSRLLAGEPVPPLVSRTPRAGGTNGLIEPKRVMQSLRQFFRDDC